MRPAWMAPKGPEGDKEEPAPGVFDRSVWQEQKYSRGLFAAARRKILKAKAYEVPEEMMTMSIAARPLFKAEKKDRDHEDGKGAPAPSPTLAPKGDPTGLPEDGGPGAAEAEGTGKKKKKDPKEPKEKKEPKEDRDHGDPADDDTGPSPYENLPGDSKDIMKLKKKLREIQKIEDAVARKEKVEPNQLEKLTKKAGYLEELDMLESISKAGPAAP